MFRKHYHIKIDLPGGIMTTGDLYALVQAAEEARAGYLQPGGRQQMYCRVSDKYGEAFVSALAAAGLRFEINAEAHPNIVSSYVTEGIFERNGGWLSEGLYKDILGGFDYRPTCKINLVDGQQCFVPFFTGNINFISSGIGNFWYLYVRWPRTTRVECWKDLVSSEDIPVISRCIDELLTAGGEGGLETLYREVDRRGIGRRQPVREALTMPRFDLPYYEGFNRYGGKSWLGIYRRDEQFPLVFLKDIATICRKTRIGQLYTTPWKSLIIKGIEERDRDLWRFVLGKYRINVRHAANELNWQVEDGNEDGLRLKRYLVRQLDQEDVRTEGLCFAIKTRPGTGLAGSVVIRKQDSGKAKAERYDILHTSDFNANSKEYVLYREGLEKENLAVYLVSLCKYFYERESGVEPAGLKAGTVKEDVAGSAAGVRVLLHQCGECLTIYDETYGDPAAGVAPGLAFDETPEDYCCPVCGAGKGGFREVEKTAVIQV